MTTVESTGQPAVVPAQQKTKKRGFVMTGGGAKGLYEAGVIQAFHLTGMEFDVITGSSIGAMNSIFFAEYLYHKHALRQSGVTEANELIDRLDDMVRAYHHAWLLMPAQKIVDDSPTGPLGKIKDDLTQYPISLPWILQTLWWYTDPDRKLPPSQPILLGLSKVVSQVFSRLAGDLLLNVIKNRQPISVRGGISSYLRKFGLERSLIPSDNAQLKNLFITPITPLTAEHLNGEVVDEPAVVARLGRPLVDSQRTLQDYLDREITVRLTRANFRTGRLEISQAVSADDFVRFLDKYDWLWQKIGPDKIPLGSFRIQVPGNPNAVEAGLCSGRFPGVFEPFPVETIYPADDPRNGLLYPLLKHWLNDRDVIRELKAAYQRMHPNWTADFLDQKFNDLMRAWSNMQAIGNYFPRAGDVYVDGGSIDNTPSNSAVDYVREWIDKQGLSRRDYQLELFMIYLSPEPKVDMDLQGDPTIYEVVGRTMKIQGTATSTADGNNVDIINTFGDRAEAVAQTLRVVLQNYQSTLASMNETERCAAQDALAAAAQSAGLAGLDGLDRAIKGDSAGLLDRVKKWDEDMLRRKLPLHVEAVKIFPEEMPMNTLQFTERLGYKKDNAIKMLANGCADTLWALRNHLELANARPVQQTVDGQEQTVMVTQTERASTGLDDQDWSALELTRRWMGGTDWPAEPTEQLKLRSSWQCHRGDACVYYRRHCPHGAQEA